MIRLCYDHAVPVAGDLKFLKAKILERNMPLHGSYAACEDPSYDPSSAVSKDVCMSWPPRMLADRSAKMVVLFPALGHILSAPDESTCRGMRNR
jgi:hypothetical protein